MQDTQPSLAGFVPPHTLADAPPDAPVLLALSGGADSRTLLHLLSLDASKKGYRLAAAHVHHGIRGEEADRDEDFCRALAAEYGVAFFSCHADVPALATMRGESVETTARAVRYEYFARLMEEEGFSLLATAHNATDNLETLLFDLTRGTSLDGLCGIPPARPFGCGMLVRPLLCVPRAQILSFAQQHALSFVTDSTNTDVTYTRNRIREGVLPVLRSVNGAIEDSATRLCETLREDATYLQAEAARLLATHREGDALPLSVLVDIPTPIASRALILLFKEYSGGVALTHKHVCDLLALAEKGVVHASLDLPAGVCAVIEGNMLTLRHSRPRRSFPPYEIPLTQGVNVISQTDCEIFMGYSQSKINVYKNSICLYLASDKIKGTIVARNRRAGDRILLCGMHKELRRLSCDKKLSLDLRARLPVLCDDEGVLAVPLLGIRDGASASTDDAHALVLQCNFF